VEKWQTATAGHDKTRKSTKPNPEQNSLTARLFRVFRAIRGFNDSNTPTKNPAPFQEAGFIRKGLALSGALAAVSHHKGQGT